MALGKLTAGLGLALTLPVLSYDSAPYDALDRGNALYEAGEHAAAIEQYERALAGLPHAAEIHFNEGDAYYRRENYGKAIEHYTLALSLDSGVLRSRIQYNLGNAKYQQALEAMQTFRDAKSLLQTAISFYRASLALDPEPYAVRYNLELAYRLLHQLEEQQVQMQRNPEVRDQRTSQNQGQPLMRQGRNLQTRDQQAVPEAEENPEMGQPQEAMQDEASTGNSVQMEQALAPQELSQQEAERMIEMVREKAKAAKSQRQQWRQARMRDGQVEKFW